MRSFWLGLTAALLFAATGCDHHNLVKNGCSDCVDGGQCTDCSENASRAAVRPVGRGHGGYVGDSGCEACGDGSGVGYGAGGVGYGAGMAGLGTHSHHRGHQPGHLLGATPTPVARLPHGYMQDLGPSGPPSPTYGYPYYTARGPRDFLLNNPPSIGP